MSVSQRRQRQRLRATVLQEEFICPIARGMSCCGASMPRCLLDRYRCTVIPKLLQACIQVSPLAFF